MSREASPPWIVIPVLLFALCASCAEDKVTFSEPSALECLIVSPSDGSVHGRGDTIEVVVDVSGGSGTIRSVRFDIDGVSAYEDNGEPFVMRWATAYQQLGGHTISVTAWDNEDATATHSVAIELEYRYRT